MGRRMDAQMNRVQEAEGYDVKPADRGRRDASGRRAQELGAGGGGVDDVNGRARDEAAEAEGLHREWTGGGVNGTTPEGAAEAEKNCFRPAPPTFRPMIFRKTESPRPYPSTPTENSKLSKFDNCQKMTNYKML